MGTHANPDRDASPRSTPGLWIIALVIALAGMRLVTASLVNLTEDEAYYRLWALAPAWGYLDHPPMVAWWIYAGHLVFGDTALGVRAPAIVAGLIGAAVLWRTAFVLTRSAEIADRAVLFLQATLLIGLGGMMMTPDAPVVLFWGLALWCLVEWQAKPSRDRDARWFVLLGLFAGLGLLSKYSMLFFGAGLVLWLALNPKRWAVFLLPWLWLGGLLAITLFSPVLFWNAAHDWVSFEKQFGRAVADQFTFRFVGEMIGGIFGLLNPLIGVLMLSAFRPGLFRTSQDAIRLILVTSLPFLIYLSYHVFHARVQANWPAPLYPGFVLIAAMAAADAKGRILGAIARLAAPVGLVLSVVLAVHAVSPLTTIPGRKDPILRTTAGWPDLAQDIGKIADAEKAVYLATSSYVLTAELAYFFKEGPEVTPLTEPERYLNGALTPLQNKTFDAPTPGLYVVLERRDGFDLSVWFEEHTLIAEVPRSAGDTVLETYRVYRVTR